MADKFEAEPFLTEILKYIENEVIPGLDSQKTEDKEMAMEILDFFSHHKHFQRAFGLAFQKVLSFDAEFIQSFRGKIDSEIYMDLLDKKLAKFRNAGPTIMQVLNGQSIP